MGEESDDRKETLNVTIKPKDYIAFEGNEDEKRKDTLRLTNRMDVDVAYKLKGTSPDVIKMKPGYGYLKPKEKAAITIVMYPLKNRPRPPTHERITVLLALAPPLSERPSKPADFWRQGLSPKNPLRVRIPIKVQGYDGFKHRSIYKKRRGSKKSSSISSEKDKSSKEGKKRNA